MERSMTAKNLQRVTIKAVAYMGVQENQIGFVQTANKDNL